MGGGGGTSLELTLEVDVAIPGMTEGWKVIYLEFIGSEFFVAIEAPDGSQQTSGLCDSWLEALEKALGDDRDRVKPGLLRADPSLPARPLLLALCAYLGALAQVALEPAERGLGSEPMFYEVKPLAQLVDLTAARQKRQHGSVNS